MQSMLLNPFSWIADFFKALFDLIPKVMYLLYASFSCVIDVLQLFFRKLAGLDVFYIEQNGQTVKVAGDLVTSFITGILGINENGFQYSALSTVFWSMVLFGVIICFVSVFIALIKAHYSYNEDSAKGPMPIIYTGLKSILNIAVVPIVVVLALYLSQAILTALDSMTSITSGNIEQLYGDKTSLLVSTKTARATANNSDIIGVTDETTYIFYDVFGYESAVFYNSSWSGLSFSTGNLAKIASTQQSFSGSVFKVAAYNANRARNGEMNTSNPTYTGGSQSGLQLFANAESNAQAQDTLANMIDTAFSCNLHLKQGVDLNYSYGGSWTSLKYFTNFLTRSVGAFSKFNIGLVWYYYDLWQFNFIVGFGAIIVCVSIFINIILGLITRLFMCIGLFLIAPPLFGLTPLDKGQAAKNWLDNFRKQVLMAYGAVVGMNIFLLILPYMNEIKFFNVTIADYLAQTLIIIVGLITIKAFIETISNIIGAADAQAEGSKIQGEVGQTLGKAASYTLGAARAGTAVWKGAAKGTMVAAKYTGKAALAVGKGAVKTAGFVGRSIDRMTGGRISGAARAAGRGIKGGIAKVGGTVGRGLKSAGSKFMGSKVGQGFKWFGGKVGSAGKAVGRFGKWAGGKVGGLGKKIGGSIKNRWTGDAALNNAKEDLDDVSQLTTMQDMLDTVDKNNFDEKAFRDNAGALGISDARTDAMIEAIKEQQRGLDVGKAYDSTRAMEASLQRLDLQGDKSARQFNKAINKGGDVRDLLAKSENKARKSVAARQANVDKYQAGVKDRQAARQQRKQDIKDGKIPSFSQRVSNVAHRAASRAVNAANSAVNAGRNAISAGAGLLSFNPKESKTFGEGFKKGFGGSLSKPPEQSKPESKGK